MGRGSIDVKGSAEGRARDVLTDGALHFVAGLQRAFGPRREALLRARAERQRALAAGPGFGFLAETEDVRRSAWRVREAPRDLQDRRVEITGPVDRKMMINALNSGARVFMADFEDALSPSWSNVVQGHVNLADAVRRELAFTSPDGKRYALRDEVATLVVRPRGWHLPEKHLVLDGKPVSASLADVGLHAFHNADALRAAGTGLYLYLPKLESHHEAQLWSDVLTHIEEALGLPRGTVRATVLIETLPAAFEMDEILHALRDHAAGLNAGRWDYLFSAIKKLRHTDLVLPDRAELTMAQPFFRAYCDLLVQTCHRRGAHAIGGMAAFIPDRRDAAVTERALAKVREDKEREASQGFDGTWVAHPDLVPVAMEVFDRALGSRPHQLHVLREEAHVDARQLLGFPRGAPSEAGLRGNLRVALVYTERWLQGQGAVAIDHLMEDAATAEIARSQVWQWVRHGLATPSQVRALLDAEVAKLPAGPESRVKEARALVEEAALRPEFVEFLTIPAYDHLE